jgi:hypothetical protein
MYDINFLCFILLQIARYVVAMCPGDCRPSFSSGVSGAGRVGGSLCSSAEVKLYFSLPSCLLTSLLTSSFDVQSTSRSAEHPFRQDSLPCTDVCVYTEC